MIWKGKELKHFGVLQQVMSELTSKEEAEAFRDAYRKASDQADKKLAILTGYFSDEKARQLREWMRLVHPLEQMKGLSVLEAFNHGFNTGLRLQARAGTRKA